MVFAWDEKKDLTNRRKHGVTFESAARVFEDEGAVSYVDRIVDGEERWHTIGSAGGIVLLLVVTLWRRKMAKKKSASSRREKRIPASELFTIPISDRQRAELEALRRMPDSKIDYSDAPSGKPGSRAIYVGRFYRPLKQQISLRVDADVLAWFRSRGKKYQTYMNSVLRREMRSGLRGR